MAARPDDAAGADDTSPAEGAAPDGGAPAGTPRSAGDGAAGPSSAGPSDAGPSPSGSAPSGSSPAGSSPPGSSPSGPPDGDDAVWAAIVARLQDVDLAADAAGPSAGRVVRPAAAEPAPPADEDVPRLVGRDWDGTSQYDAAEDAVDEAEHFVPPDPGPVLGGDPLLTMAWGAAVGVPLLLLVVVVAWRDAPVLLVRAAVGLFVVAVGVLVWRMPHRRDPSDDDPGAVV